MLLEKPKTTDLSRIQGCFPQARNYIVSSTYNFVSILKKINFMISF